MDYVGGSLSWFLINVFLSKSRTGGLNDDSRVKTVHCSSRGPGYFIQSRDSQLTSFGGPDTLFCSLKTNALTIILAYHIHIHKTLAIPPNKYLGKKNGCFKFKKGTHHVKSIKPTYITHLCHYLQKSLWLMADIMSRNLSFSLMTWFLGCRHLQPTETLGSCRSHTVKK